MRELLEGQRGPDVLLMQSMLNHAKSLLPRLKEDGIFGPKTKARVCEYQKAHGLKPDGITGPLTGSTLARHSRVPDGQAKAGEARAVWYSSTMRDRPMRSG